MFVCLFVCLIITHEPLDQFVSNFDWGTRENHGNVLNLVLRFSESTFKGKNSKNRYLRPSAGKRRELL